ncbi:MAG: hypothetical protein KGL39_05320 [Patescibacteria group bacterium]|nr:hypothetical protein [Patescibacteria group bacterium]
MQLPNAGSQGRYHYLYDASGTIASNTLPQLLLPQTPSRSFFQFQNLSSAAMYLEFGSARATCTISGGAVNGFSITNAGFNFTKPPIVRFAGGGRAGNTSYLGLNQPGGEGPNSAIRSGQIATAIATIGAGSGPGLTVTAITLTNPGSGYVIAPYVFISNSDLDPYGCAIPSATQGVFIAPSGGSIYFNGTSCPTDSISVFCGTAASAFSCKWMT